MKTRKTNKISDNTIRRLPRYLRCLDELERQGNTRVSSAVIGNHLNNTPSQVRQDLSQFGSYGMQGYGYNIESLRASIHAILGTDATHTVIIAGIGSLGHALLEHLPLAANGYQILAGFDVDPKLIGQKINGVPILNSEDFGSFIENHLREKDYSFDYAKQPSKAMFKYRKAFLRNDGERYNAFLEAVSSGEKQLHADNLAPYEIVRSALDANRWGFNARLTDGEKAALNASWASLPDFCDNRNALAVVDTSGSMYCYDNALPAAVALSLGLYFGERNTGIFHNHFIEFSSRPQLIEIKGKTFAERLEYLCTFNEVADTNVEAVFDLILDAAVRNNVPQEELPETLYLISDMEFNACVRNASVSNFASAKRRFAEHGYRLPQIVFWNVASRNSNQPVTKNEQGVALVSGCTPRLFSMVASGDLSPYSVMMDIIESERYAKISA